MAGLIPQNFIDDLIARTDIVSVINARVPLKRKGKEYMACCPFHNEKTPSFTVSEAKQFFYCFGCHAKGNAIGFLMDYEHMSYVEAIETLAAEHNLEVPHEQGSNHHKKRDDQQALFDALKQASSVYQGALRNSPRAINYLKQRGLSGEIAKRFSIGYAPDAWDTLLKPASAESVAAMKQTGLLITNDKDKTYDRFRDRIMFPITDQRGRIIGFGGRILDKGEPKYLNSPENSVFHKGYELYGLYQVKQALRNIERIIVVEGYMDVVALAQHDINYAVASLGTATTSDQIQKLLRTCHEIVFCYDGDNAGKKAAWRALENTLPLLRDGHVFRFLFLPEGEDPDTMVRAEGKQAFEQRIINATPLSDFLFNSLKSQVDISSREGKVQFASKASKLIERMHNSLFKDLLLDELAEISGLGKNHLEEKIEATPASPAVMQQENNQLSQQSSIRKGDRRLRLAVALLVQAPELASTCALPSCFASSGNPGLKLLHAIAQIILQNPGIQSAALAERFRGTENESIIQKLSFWRSPDTENTEMHTETFSQTVASLHYDERFELLFNKQLERSPLSAEEADELKLLTEYKNNRSGSVFG